VAGAGGQNPARLAGVLAGERREEGLGVTGIWVLAGVGVGVAPEVGRDGGPRQRARQLRHR
jgi:hypothetical protein